MCVVSMVGEWGRQIYDPGKIPVWTSPAVPSTIPIQFDYSSFQKYMELLEKARKYDELTGQKECESQEKIAWLKEIQSKLEQLQDQSDCLSDSISVIKKQVDNFLYKINPIKNDFSNNVPNLNHIPVSNISAINSGAAVVSSSSWWDVKEKSQQENGKHF